MSASPLSRDHDQGAFMTTDLGTTNFWLAILAIAVVLQTAMILVAALAALRVVKRAESTLTKAEQMMQPLAASLSSAVDDLHDITDAARRAGDSVRNTAEQLGSGVRQARGLLMGELWPALGALRAAKSAISAFSARRRVRKLDRDDRIAEARFVSEGAPVHGSR